MCSMLSGLSPVGKIIQVSAGTPVCWLMTCNSNSLLLQNYGNMSPRHTTKPEEDMAYFLTLKLLLHLQLHLVFAYILSDRPQCKYLFLCLFLRCKMLLKHSRLKCKCKILRLSEWRQRHQWPFVSVFTDNCHSISENQKARLVHQNKNKKTGKNNNTHLMTQC